MAVGAVLVEEGRLGARLLGKIARLLGVTTRTLSSWKALARRQGRGERLPMVGRPAHSAAAREAALERVARVRRCEVDGRRGARFEPAVTRIDGRAHLPVVELKRAA